MISCSNDEITDDLQGQIDELEATIETLQGTITSLQSSLQSATSAQNTLSSDLDSAEAALAAAQAALNTARGLVDEATTDITALEAALAFVNNALAGIDYSATVSLDATGSVASQTPAQAMQTIYGKWNIGGAAAKSIQTKEERVHLISSNLWMIPTFSQSTFLKMVKLDVCLVTMS